MYRPINMTIRSLANLLLQAILLGQFLRPLHPNKISRQEVDLIKGLHVLVAMVEGGLVVVAATRLDHHAVHAVVGLINGLAFHLGSC